MTIARPSARWTMLVGAPAVAMASLVVALLGPGNGFPPDLLNHSAVAGSTTVPVAADAYASHSAPKRNYGSDPRWSLDGRWNAWRHGFLKFHLPTAAAGTTYTHVTLRVFGESAPPKGKGPVVYRTGNDWLETTLSWENQPYRARRLAGAGKHTDHGWTDFDVTSTIPGPGTTVSFRIETTDPAWIGFDSKEKDGGHGAQLVVKTETTGHAPKPAPVAGTTTAADTEGWGEPVAGDEFGYVGPPDPAKWNAYHSAGHAGKGLRRPSAWKVDGTVARVMGDPQGTTGGMSANFGRRMYGRWETRMRTNARDPEYHPVLILWPDSGNWPCDGEIDYAEGAEEVTEINVFQHYSCANRQTMAKRTVDTTQWHNYAVQWSPRGIIGYIDGEEWFRDMHPRHQPPGPMHQTVQLDWFPDGTATSMSWMEVDWVRVYDLKPRPISPKTPRP